MREYNRAARHNGIVQRTCNVRAARSTVRAAKQRVEMLLNMIDDKFSTSLTIYLKIYDPPDYILYHSSGTRRFKIRQIQVQTNSSPKKYKSK